MMILRKIIALLVTLVMIVPTSIVVFAETSEIVSSFSEKDEVTGVSTFAELQEALENATEESDKITKITLASDIDITGSGETYISIAGSENKRKNVKIDGCGKRITQKYNRKNWPENSAGNKGLFVVTNANVTFENVTIDANYGGNGDSTENTGAYLNNLYVANATVTLENGAVLANGGPFGTSKGTAAGLMGSATLEMKTGSKITGAMCKGDTSTSSTIYINGADNKFIMNGGEISGNTSGISGLIYANHESKTGTEIILNSGSIKGNSYKTTNYGVDDTNYKTYKGNQAKAIRFNGDGGITLKIGGDMVVDESIFLDKSHKYITVTSALKNPIKINEYWVPDTLAKGNNEYTLTAKDAAKFVFENNTKKVYLDSTKNEIKCISVSEQIPAGGIAPDTSVEDLEIAGESISEKIVTFNLKSNKSDGEISGKYIVGLYDDGVLVSVALPADEAKIAANGTAVVDINLPTDRTDLTGLTAKVFVWNSLEEMIPQVGYAEKQY